MSDEDWRVQARLADSNAAKRLHAAATERELAGHGRAHRGERAALSRDDAVIFAYATTRAHAQAAQAALAEVAAAEHLEVTFALTRWHPLAERWEDPDVALAVEEPAVAAELQARAADEGHDSDQPEWEVRVTLASHREAVELAQQLADEGLASQRHWHYVLLGAWTEADAQALAQRLRAEVPAARDVRVEGTFAFVLENSPEARHLYSPFVPF